MKIKTVNWNMLWVLGLLICARISGAETLPTESAVSTAVQASADTKARIPVQFASPRDLLRYFIENVNDEKSERAAAVMSLPADFSDAQRKQAAKRLKYILDQNRLIVYDEIPDAAMARKNSLTDYMVCDVIERGLASETKLGAIRLVKIPATGYWYISSETTSRIDDWYARLGPGFIEQYLPAFFLKKFLNVSIWQYTLMLLFIFLGLLTRKIAIVVMIGRIYKWAQNTRATWDDKLVELATTPFSFAVMTLLWLILIRTIGLTENIFFYLNVSIKAGFIISVVWLFYRLADVFGEYLKNLADKTDSKLDDQLVPIARKSLKVFIVLVGALFILQNFNIDIWSLMAGLGLGGLAFALAAQDTVKNLFGSVMIFLDRPFQIGDWIIIGSIEGNVEEVGFRSTRIRTFSKSLVTIPNSQLANENIENMSARPRQRIKAWFGVEYGTSPEQIEWLLEEIRKKILSNDRFAHDYMQVWFTDFGDSSLNIMLYTYVLGGVWADFLEQRQWLYLEIMKLCRKQGIHFAFPTQTLHIETLAKPRDTVPDRDHIAQLQSIAITDPLPPGFIEKAPPHVGKKDDAGTPAADAATGTTD